MKCKLVSIGLSMTLIATSAPTLAADLSANVGFNSEYIFRGIPQKTSSAFGGLDLEAGGFYLGTWGADVGDGLELDYYGGYRFEVDQFSFGIGGTVYTYTGDFDDTYKEVNFSAGWSFLTFDAAVGNYENFSGPQLDYAYYSLTAELNGFFGRIATFADDFDGTYYEAGYGSTLTVEAANLLDYAFTLIYSDSTLLGGESDTNFVVTLSKSFDF
ncbi:MAG: TorF family putative porin [Xanthomonadales bacterium]|nr:TorF family putative porin [Xanthomonadales bacterium]